MILLLKIAESKRAEAMKAYQRALRSHKGTEAAWKKLRDATSEVLRLELDAAKPKRRKAA